MGRHSELFDRLALIVGGRHVLTDAEALTAYTRDWTDSFGGPALAVAQPASAEQVAGVVMACAEHGATVLPQGGNTGLVGGGVPAAVGDETARRDDVGPVIISTRRLQELGSVDATTGHVHVGAGVTLQRLQEHAAAAEWMYGVDLAARGSATLGGTIATNAGGIRVCAYGMTRAQVLAVEVVLADGSIVRHRRDLPKDNTGYDLAGLFTGSEGTLGVITAATVRLWRQPPESTVALVGVADYETALATARQAVDGKETLLAAEVMDQTGMRAVCESAQLPWPLAREHPLVVLLEVSGARIDLSADSDAVVAVDRNDTLRLWRYRELQPEAILAHRGPGRTVQKLDVSVPPAALDLFTARLAAELASMTAVHHWSVFGHLADGNLHLQLACAADGADAVTLAVLELVARFDGSISAEHGIGRAKAAYLHLSRSPAEVAAMRAIKRGLDPTGLFAPGVIFPPTG